MSQGRGSRQAEPQKRFAKVWCLQDSHVLVHTEQMVLPMPTPCVYQPPSFRNLPVLFKGHCYYVSFAASLGQKAEKRALRPHRPPQEGGGSSSLGSRFGASTPGFLWSQALRPRPRVGQDKVEMLRAFKEELDFVLMGRMEKVMHCG